MRMILNCNQSGKRFSGVEVEGDPQPFTVALKTPAGIFKVDVPPGTIMTGILPVLRTFVISNADRFGVTVENTGGASARKGGRLLLKEEKPKK